MSEADVITRMLHAIDARDWATLRASFADVVRVDYTSLWGGEPATVAADDLVADWRPFALGFSATQHLTGPVLISDGRAHAHVCARHWLPDAEGGDVWAVYGHYIAAVADGKITELTFQTFHQEGNRDLPAIVRQRAAVTR
jgi:hypothetical protein